MEPEDLDLTPTEEPLRRIWDALDRLPEEQPGPALRQRFYRMLDEEMESAPRKRSAGRSWREVLTAIFPQPVRLGVAWALPALVIGVLLGTRVPGAEKKGEISELRQEVHSLSRLVTLSLLQQESASERLKGVSYGRSIGPTDERVLSALLTAVKEDPNVNVRLAAIDALGSVVERPNVQKWLVDSLPRQDSPMVQIALVDLLADAPGAKPLLSRVADDPDVDPTVRDYLRRRIESRI
jgi:HEAT repeat protein